MNPRINKLLDFVERVGWTFVQAFVGSLLALDLTGDVKWNKVLYSALIAGGIAAGKVILAQNIGSGDDGAIPSAVTPPPK